jgi:hypothetical protein
MVMKVDLKIIQDAQCMGEYRTCVGYFEEISNGHALFKEYSGY